MKIWLDDVRPAPDGWRWAKTVPDARVMIQEAAKSLTLIEALSCDNDLGEGLDEGYTLLDFVEEQAYFKLGIWWRNMTCTVHSGNVGRVPYMEATIESIKRLQKLAMSSLS